MYSYIKGQPHTLVLILLAVTNGPVDKAMTNFVWLQIINMNKRYVEIIPSYRRLEIHILVSRLRTSRMGRSWLLRNVGTIYHVTRCNIPEGLKFDSSQKQGVDSIFYFTCVLYCKFKVAEVSCCEDFAKKRTAFYNYFFAISVVLFTLVETFKELYA